MHGFFGALVLAVMCSTTAASQEQPRVILVAREGVRSPELRALHAAIRVNIQELPVELQVTPTRPWPRGLSAQATVARRLAAGSDVKAVFWLTVRLSRVMLYVIVPQSDQILVRSVAETSPTVRAEVLGTVLKSTITAILQGAWDEVAMAPAPSQPAAVGGDAGLDDPASQLRSAEPDNQTARDSDEDHGYPAHRLGLEASYSPSVVATDTVAHAVSLAGTVRLGSVWLYLAYRVTPPLDSVNEELTLRLFRHPVSFGIRWLWGSTLRLGPALEVSLDYTTQRPTKLARATTASTSEHFTTALVPLFRVEYQLSDRIAAVVDLGAAIAFNPVRFAIDTPTGRKSLWQPFVVQPRASAGLVLQLF